MTITAPITIRTTATVLMTQSPFIDCIEQLMGPCWPPPPIELRLGVGDVTRSGDPRERNRNVSGDNSCGDPPGVSRDLPGTTDLLTDPQCWPLAKQGGAGFSRDPASLESRDRQRLTGCPFGPPAEQLLVSMQRQSCICVGASAPTITCRLHRQQRLRFRRPSRRRRC
jgi:hypothetical protein